MTGAMRSDPIPQDSRAPYCGARGRPRSACQHDGMNVLPTIRHNLCTALRQASRRFAVPARAGLGLQQCAFRVKSSFLRGLFVKALVLQMLVVQGLWVTPAQAQPQWRDPRQVADQLQIAGVSRCISVITVWTAGLVNNPQTKADSPEFRFNSALMDFYGKARRHLISSMGNPAVSGAIDNMVRQQGEYFGNIVRFQGWNAVIPEYKKCADQAQLGPSQPSASAAPPRPAPPPAVAPAVSTAPSAASAAPAQPAVATSAPASAGGSTPTDCDTLAGSPMDPVRVTSGVAWDRLDAAQAVPACKAAITAAPQNGRAWFQYGRALERANQLPQAIDAYRRAAELDHAAAHNNLGELYRDAKGVSRDVLRAEDLFARSAKLGSSEGADNHRTIRKTHARYF